MATTIALVAASLDIVGGQGLQARAVADHLAHEGYKVDVVAVNPRFPRALAWLRRLPVIRRVLNDGFLSGGGAKTSPLQHRLHEQLCRVSNLAAAAWIRLLDERSTPELAWLSPHVYSIGRRNGNPRTAQAVVR